VMLLPVPAGGVPLPGRTLREPLAAKPSRQKKRFPLHQLN
jgi:hypothetical protein